jgi:choline-sulfatase
MNSSRAKVFLVFLTSVTLAAIGLGMAILPGRCQAAETPPSRPNILLIMTDQQHAGMLSCAGNPHVKTPAMDSLAATGMRFERAYCAHPLCMPSRFSMMSGIMPSRLGVTNSGGEKVPQEIIDGALGSAFRSAGYRTVYGGKTHAHMSLETMGFETIRQKNRGDAGLAEASARFLRQPHDRPFLLVASFDNPHDICYMAIDSYGQRDRQSVTYRAEALSRALKLPEGVSREEFFARVCPPLPANYEPQEGEPQAILSPDGRAFRAYARTHWTDEQWRMHRWAYARLTELVDGQIGQVLTALREAGLEDNTLVVFTSDHGDMDASHRLEHKSVLYEESARVPMIVSWKGVTKPGIVDRTHLVSTGLDLIPTLCDFAGVPAPAALKGRSVRALAEGRKPDSWRDTLVVESGPARMLRSARYKYVVYRNGEEQLMDLEADPGEMRNLARDAKFEPVLVEHRRLLKEWYRDNGETWLPK